MKRSDLLILIFMYFCLNGCSGNRDRSICTDVVCNDKVEWAYLIGNHIEFGASIDDIEKVFPENFKFDYSYDSENSNQPSESSDLTLLVKADTIFNKTDVSKTFEYIFEKNRLKEVVMEFYLLSVQTKVTDEYISANNLTFLLNATEKNKCYTFLSGSYVVEFSKHTVSLSNSRSTVGYKVKVKHR